MGEIEETMIGAVLYAASPKNYEVHNLIFTPTEIIAASTNWRDKSAFSDIGGVLLSIIMFPFQPPRSNLDTMLTRNWFEIKKLNKGRPYVSYQPALFDEVLSQGSFGMALHKISRFQYGKINAIVLTESPLTNDYKVKIDSGSLSSNAFLIPEEALAEFKELIAKTPLAHKLDLRISAV